MEATDWNKRRNKSLALNMAEWFEANKGIIFLTFEIFWIVVFLLEKATNEQSLKIPQFIYVNF
jgi:hypothetical protein